MKIDKTATCPRCGAAWGDFCFKADGARSTRRHGEHPRVATRKARRAEREAAWERYWQDLTARVRGAGPRSDVAALRALGLTGPATAADVQRSFRRLALRAHPDHAGGSDEAMKRLIDLRERALAAAGAS